MRTSTEKLAAALHILANDIQSADGVANVAILEAAVRLREQDQRIKQLIAERDTARLQADQKVSLREEFRELLGTDDIKQGVDSVKAMKARIKRLEEALDCVVVSCACLHHPKKYQHKLDEACPVEVLIRKARKTKP